MRALIFDTETTDLLPNSLLPIEKQPRVIEFFGQHVDTETGQVLSELEFLCSPGIKVTPLITKITGIKDEDVRALPGWRAHDAKVRAFLQEGADMVVAHNLSYDLKVVETECKRCGTVPIWPKLKLCTVEGTEHLKGFRLSLSNMHELLFGEKFEGAHRAREDVQALTRCFLELTKRGEV